MTRPEAIYFCFAGMIVLVGCAIIGDYLGRWFCEAREKFRQWRYDRRGMSAWRVK